MRAQAELESGVGGAGGALGTHLADGLRLPSGYLQLLCQRMAAAVSLKRASFNWATGGLEMLLRPELMAALDLKSAHGPDHSGRGVPNLEPHCKSHRPLSGLGLWCSALGPAASQEPCFKTLLSKMLTASAHLYLSQAKSWFLAIVNKRDCFPFHQHGLLEASCSPLRGGCVGPRSMSTECPAVVRRRRAALAWGEVLSHSQTQRETMLSKSTAQGSLRCSFRTCGVLGGRESRRSWLCFYQTGGV